MADETTLHPLVIINISDHFTRMRANSAPGAAVPRVYGAVLGEQVGRRVELATSFEMKMTVGPSGVVSADLTYLRDRLEQYKKTFPRFDMLGWYSTAGAVLEGDMALHQQLCELNESLLYLGLDPAPLLGGGGGTGELPIALFESEVAVVNDMPTMRFAKIGYKVDSIESERIAVEHVAHILPSGESNQSSAFSQSLGGMHTALQMLHERIAVICRYLAEVQDHNNTLLVAQLAAITKGTALTNDIIDKFNVAYDKHSRRRGIF